MQPFISTLYFAFSMFLLIFFTHFSAEMLANCLFPKCTLGAKIVDEFKIAVGNSLKLAMALATTIAGVLGILFYAFVPIIQTLAL
ncbi:hypothetical protein FACS189499_07580 [Clostridia bacterium]|nr:hypothetical protein FACS189499_07580 [Clostridia bacterium]